MMKKEVALNDATPREILETIIEEQVPGIMSYLSRGRWHVAKVQIVRLGANRLGLEVIQSSSQKPHPVNIRVDQPVGLSIKYGYGKFVFETKVLDLRPSSKPGCGGVLDLSVPDRIEIVQRRSYFRVKVPSNLLVEVVMWHRYMGRDRHSVPRNYWSGRLIDISAGGMQIVVSNDKSPDFKMGQFITLRMTPLPYDQHLVVNAQIRNVLPTADGEKICYGLQLVGLEASVEGRETLKRLCDIVEKYYQMKKANDKEQKCQAQTAQV